MRKFVALLLLFVLCGCQAVPHNAKQTDTVLFTPIYTIQSDMPLLRAYEYALPKGSLDERINALFSALSLPAHLRAYALRSGVLTLDLSYEYQSLTGMERTLSDACVVLSYCAWDEVDAVTITVEGNPSFGRDAFEMTPQMFLLEAPSPNADASEES